MSIRSLDDLQPGDIMISGMKTAPTRLLVYGGQILLREHFRIGPFVAGHAGMIGPDGRLIEAMPEGARVRRLHASDWSVSHAYFRLPEDYPGQALDAAHVARAMIGTPYSFASYAYLGAYLAGLQTDWLARHIDRRRHPWTMVSLPSGRISTHALPVEVICSVLPDQAWSLTGKTVVTGTRSQVVTPGMLTQHLWRGDIVRGGLGIF